MVTLLTQCRRQFLSSHRMLVSRETVSGVGHNVKVRGQLRRLSREVLIGMAVPRLSPLDYFIHVYIWVLH